MTRPGSTPCTAGTSRRCTATPSTSSATITPPRTPPRATSSGRSPPCRGSRSAPARPTAPAHPRSGSGCSRSPATPSRTSADRRRRRRPAGGPLEAAPRGRRPARRRGGRGPPRRCRGGRAGRAPPAGRPAPGARPALRRRDVDGGDRGRPRPLGGGRARAHPPRAARGRRDLGRETAGRSRGATSRPPAVRRTDAATGRGVVLDAPRVDCWRPATCAEAVPVDAALDPALLGAVDAARARPRPVPSVVPVRGAARGAPPGRPPMRTSRRAGAAGRRPSGGSTASPAPTDAHRRRRRRRRPERSVPRPLLIGGALTSAALSIAGAYVAWRRGRPAARTHGPRRPCGAPRSARPAHPRERRALPLRRRREGR